MPVLSLGLSPVPEFEGCCFLRLILYAFGGGNRVHIATACPLTSGSPYCGKHANWDCFPQVDCGKQNFAYDGTMSPS